MASRRWAIVLCRFADVAKIPNQPQFYRTFFSESGAGTKSAFDYWKDVTYGVIDLKGSKVFGWFDTTKTDADYQTLNFPGDRHIVRLALRHSPFTAAARKDWSSVRDAVSVPNCR